jgi:hypothetical protein
MSFGSNGLSVGLHWKQIVADDCLETNEHKHIKE